MKKILFLPIVATFLLILSLPIGDAHAQTPSNVVFNKGSVMVRAQNFLIFWEPSGTNPVTGNPYAFDGSIDSGANSAIAGDNTYEALIQDYFKDICNSQFYSLLNQYTGIDPNNPKNTVSTGPCTFGGIYVDHDPFPTESSGQPRGTFDDPLNDGDLQAEVEKVRNLKGWDISPDQNEFFVFTPFDVYGCITTKFVVTWYGGCTFKNNNPSGTSSGFYSNPSNNCGWHGFYNTITGGVGPKVIYAYIPDYGTALSGKHEAACGVPGSSPNGDPFADATIGVVSHEQFESVSDPYGDAWNGGNSGVEIGDLCVGNFPTSPDVVLDGDPYLVQEMWDNTKSHCDLNGNTSSDELIQCPQYVYTAVSTPVTFTCSITSENGFTGQVSLTNGEQSYYSSVDESIDNYTPTINQNRQTTVSVTFGSSTIGRYSIYLQGDTYPTSGADVETLSNTITVDVVPPLISFGIGPYVVNTGPSSYSSTGLQHYKIPVEAGSTNVDLISNFNGQVTLSTTQPAGMTVNLQNPVTVSPGTASIPVTVSVPLTFPSGHYCVTVNAQSGTFTASTEINVGVGVYLNPSDLSMSKEEKNPITGKTQYYTAPYCGPSGQIVFSSQFASSSGVTPIPPHIIPPSAEHVANLPPVAYHPQQPIPSPYIQSGTNSTSKNNPSIPYWIKNTANWWSNGQVSDAEFIKSLQYLIDKKMITVSTTTTNTFTVGKGSAMPPWPGPQVPSWVKNTAGMWAAGKISDREFLSSVQYLVSKGIVIVARVGTSGGSITASPVNIRISNHGCPPISADQNLPMPAGVKFPSSPILSGETGSGTLPGVNVEIKTNANGVLSIGVLGINFPIQLTGTISDVQFDGVSVAGHPQSFNLGEKQQHQLDVFCK